MITKLKKEFAIFLSVLKLSKNQSMQLALASSSAQFFWVCELDGLELVAILRLFEASRNELTNLCSGQIQNLQATEC